MSTLATGAPDTSVKPLFTEGQRRGMLGLLLAIYTCNYIDRIIMSTLGPAIKQDLHLSDTQFGLLVGLSFAMFFSVLGVPLGRVAERVNRVGLMVVCILGWSVMTAVCGVTTTYWQLLMCRMGVGIGEAGCTPTSQSLISDYFPPNRRASAIAIFGLGVPIGSLIGASMGGWIAQEMNWRAAFFVAGAPGVVLALLAMFFLREPPRGHSEGLNLSKVAPPSLMAVLKRMIKRPSFLHLTIGCALTSFANNGIGQFTPSYFNRYFGLSYAQGGLNFGIIMGVSGLIGVYGGGVVCDRISRGDKRWYAWTPALGVLLASPCYLIGLAQSDWHLMMLMNIIGGAFMFFNWAPTMAAAQNMAEPRMRASVAALLLLFMNLIGMGFGPYFAGFTSDKFASHLFAMGDYAALCPGGIALKGSAAELMTACKSASAIGVHHSMIVSSLIFLWAMAHYLLAAKTLRKDLNPDVVAVPA